jgi:glycosyltransferase involved in cell wall biosynthesis
VRVLLADPPAFTPAYDHELARALAAAGAEVELVTSRFHSGEAPAPEGYRRNELFYPLSSRLFRRSRLRIPLKAVEHAAGLERLKRLRADVVHVQWLVPEVDRRRLALRAPSVFTAHDILPRRTAHRLELWRDLLGRFDRVVVHSERGRETLAALDVDARVIPHPVFRREVERRDDGRTILCFGVIRAYKGIPDAVEAARRLGDARLLVVGDPVDETVDVTAPGVEWRLGYVSEPEAQRAHAEATLAVFPYRPELDQSGALMRALGSGVPAVVYDVGGLADPIRAYGAGRVVPAGDLDALTEAIRELLDDPAELEAARAGALRARDALTWDSSAQAHLALYRELVPA